MTAKIKAPAWAIEEIDRAIATASDEPPPVNGEADYGLQTGGMSRHGAVGTRQSTQGTAPPEPPPRLVGPVTIAEWLSRDTPVPDRILGEWLTTTSRVVLNAATGIGKTNLALAIAGHVAAGKDFLHWRAHRPTRTLFVDGEMSRRLLKRRVAAMIRRLGVQPDHLYLLSHEDVENFQPLNTPAGRAFIEQLVAEHCIDLVIFDNVMSLVAGCMIDEEAWGGVLPLITSLTKGDEKQGRAPAGQLWIHHTGHDKSRGYGTSTREWRMDTVAIATEAKRADTDVSFTLEFTKAREREPETRRDFEPVTLALVNDQWEGSVAAEKHGKVSPLGGKFLEALQDAFTDGETVPFQGWQAVNDETWRAECFKRGLLDPKAKPDSARSLFSKHKRELIAANLIGCNDKLVWPL